MDEGEEVVLHIYDLSGGLAAQLSAALTGQQINGIWHTGVCVFAREYFFGGDGVQDGVPGRTQYGSPVRRLVLGRTQLTQDAVRDLLASLAGTSFAPGTYRLLDYNCNTFSECFASLLTGKNNPVPREVMDQVQRVLQTPLAAAVLGSQPVSATPTVVEAVPAQQPSLLPTADDADAEAAFQAAVRAEFESLLAAAPGTDTDEAASLAVSRVLARQGLT